MARRCGAKRIIISKCTKHLRAGPIWEVQILKNGRPLWREAHYHFKMHKTPPRGTNLGSSDLEKWQATVARSTFASQNAQNTSARDQFGKFRSRKMAGHCGAKHTFASQNSKKKITAFFELPMSTLCHAAVARSAFVSQNVWT